MPPPTLVGRSSSHFTRTARIFALELGVLHGFTPLLDLTSVDPTDYAGNPALKIPILKDERGSWFGTENICREFALRSGRRHEVLLRGDIPELLVANAEELTLHAMAAEVSLIMARASHSPAPPKAMASITGSLDFLEQNLDAVLAALPAGRALSFLEVTLFCLVTHLPFRQVLEVSSWPRLTDFVERFGQRGSARATEYRFDPC